MTATTDFTGVRFRAYDDRVGLLLEAVVTGPAVTSAYWNVQVLDGDGAVVRETMRHVSLLMRLPAAAS